jgi:hypothetical protein
MSQYYNGKRTKNLYIPGRKEPFKLSHGCMEFIGIG